MFAAIAKFFTGFAGSFVTYLTVGAIAAATSGYLVHKIDHGKYADLELSYQQAQTKAVSLAKDIQASEDKVALDEAVAEAQAQTQVVTRTRNITKEVQIYVKDTSTCITYGLLRVLDAHALGVDPASLHLATAQPDDACANLKSSDLATIIAGNYDTANANAEQLNRLEKTVDDMATASQPVKK